MAVNTLIKEISKRFGLEESDLVRQSLLTFLTEKKRDYLQDRLELLSRHSVTNADELEEQIAHGIVQEHPAWEDVIVLENLETEIERIGRELERLSRDHNRGP